MFDVILLVRSDNFNAHKDLLGMLTKKMDRKYRCRFRFKARENRSCRSNASNCSPSYKILDGDSFIKTLSNGHRVCFVSDSICIDAQQFRCKPCGSLPIPHFTETNVESNVVTNDGYKLVLF